MFVRWCDIFLVMLILWRAVSAFPSDTCGVLVSDPRCCLMPTDSCSPTAVVVVVVIVAAFNKPVYMDTSTL